MLGLGFVSEIPLHKRHNGRIHIYRRLELSFQYKCLDASNA
jgi:hypothetical protein